ncbi:MAG: UvrD-helicase domain-containing protein [Oligoflexales bacterium]
MKPCNDPQSPYNSFLVCASAGSGKTYQLTQRFLKLVAVHTPVQNILAITFTNKAAGEMHERIIRLASEFMVDAEKRAEFDRAMTIFYRENGMPQGAPKPLSAQETAQKVLGSTQALNIKTIDSLFWQWLRKFGGELEGIENGQTLQLMEVKDDEVFVDLAFDRTWGEVLRNENFAVALDYLDRRNLFDLKRVVQTLTRHDSLLWFCAKKGMGYNGLSLDSDYDVSEQELLDGIAEDLREILQSLKSKNRDLMMQNLAERNLAGLQATGVVKKSELSLNESTIRGVKAKFEDKVARINETLRGYENYQKTAKLNLLGRILQSMFQAYNDAKTEIKSRKGMIDFGDLVKGCYDLYSNPSYIGARYLIQRNIDHILIDEFQDTSALQWAVFREICTEILAGSGSEKSSGSPSTVFVVGDEKQSIYGFREADYKLLGQAGEELASSGLTTVSLSANYRSSKIILDYVNRFFLNRWSEFPEHVPGVASAAKIGGIWLSDAFSADNRIESQKAEARYIAWFLKEKVEGNVPLRVWENREQAERRMGYSDCLILYRASTHLGIVEEALTNAGVPFTKDQGEGLFQIQDVKDLLSLIRWLAYPRDVQSLTEFLKSRWLRIPDDKLIAALKETRSNAKAWEEILQKVGAAEWLMFARTKSQKTFFELIADLLAELGLVKNSKANAFPWCDVWNNFLFQTISRRQITDMRELSAVLDDAAEYETIPVNSGSGNEVTLMSIHKAKGLEYPLVCLIDTHETWEKRDNYWLKWGENGSESVSYIGTQSEWPKDDFAFDRLVGQSASEMRKENERLLYVALTRAKHYLVITGSERKKQQSKQGYLADLKQALVELGGMPANLGGQESVVLTEDVSELEMTEASLGQEYRARSSEPSSPAGSASGIPSEIIHPYPTEIRFVNPHKEAKLEAETTQKTAGVQDALWKTFGRHIGQLIHRGLELRVQNRPFKAREFWDSLLKRNDASENGFELAQDLLDGVLSSPRWLDLWQDAVNIWPEMTCCERRGDQIVRGSMDLLIEKANGDLWIVDYKTAVMPSNLTPKEFVLAKRYFDQLAHYSLIVQGMYPGRTVKSCVYLTVPNVAVFLS